jgi:hypothetical protein
VTEHQFELLRDVIIAVPTIVFSGWIAYWTWWRDQENIKVVKVLPFARTAEGKWVAVDGQIGVLVTNLSLFPVKICALGYKLPGREVFELEDVVVTSEARVLKKAIRILHASRDLPRVLR